MKVGDLIRHRNRRVTNPPRTHRFLDCWGEKGIVIQVCQAGWDQRGPERAVKYMNHDGNIILAPERDVEVINESR